MSHKMPVTEGMPKICDFGAARIGAEHTGDVMPGQYRAPEVILEMKWDSKIDIWAIALTVSLLDDNMRSFSHCPDLGPSSGQLSIQRFQGWDVA